MSKPNIILQVQALEQSADALITQAMQLKDQATRLRSMAGESSLALPSGVEDHLLPDAEISKLLAGRQRTIAKRKNGKTKTR